MVAVLSVNRILRVRGHNRGSVIIGLVAAWRHPIAVQILWGYVMPVIVIGAIALWTSVITGVAMRASKWDSLVTLEAIAILLLWRVALVFAMRVSIVCRVGFGPLAIRKVRLLV